MLSERTFDAGSVSLNYVEGPPSGSPLVLMHGLSLRWQHFLPVIPMLAWRSHIYGMDFRGHGRSGKTPGRYTILEYSRDTIAFLQRQVAEPAVILGHSLGAYVAIQVAAKVSESVRAVVLEDPPIPALKTFKDFPLHQSWIVRRDIAASGHTVEHMASELAAIMPGRDAARRRTVAKSLSLADPDVITSGIEDRQFEGYDMDARLGEITVPVLLLRGDPAQGGLISAEGVKQAISLARQCLVVDFPGAGHSIHVDQPLTFCGVVADFLESL